METFKALSKKLIDDLKNLLKGYDITFGKLPTKYTEADNLNITFDNANAPPTPANTETPDVTLTFKEQ